MAQDMAAFGLPGIFDNLRDGVVLIRFPNLEIVMINRMAGTIVDMPSSKALGKNLQDILPDPDIAERARQSSEEAVGEWPGHTQEAVRSILKLPNGQERDIEVHTCRVEDVGTGGPLVLLVLRQKDISPEDHLARALRRGDTANQRVRELEKREQEKTLMFGQAVHEFNTPLTVVLMQAKILHGAMGSLPPAQERAFSTIDRNVRRLVLLAQDLLDLARVDAGKLVLDAKEFDLGEMLAKEMKGYRDLAVQQDVTLTFEPPTQPIPVRADKARMQQVLANLVSNAIKFTPKGGKVLVKIDLGTEGKVAIQVVDTGPGLDAEDQGKLFQPFARIDHPDDLKKPGTGLGLYLTKRIVEASDGKVGVSSAGRGQGSTFWFELPLAHSRPPRPKAEKTAPEEPEREPSTHLAMPRWPDEDAHKPHPAARPHRRHK